MWTKGHELKYWKKTGLSKGDSIYSKYYEAFNLKDVDFKDKIVADVGCGPFGGLSSKIKCSKYIAVDVLANDYKKMGKSSVAIVKGDLRKNLPIENGTCDYVICTNAIDHVPDVKHSMKELSRILKVGGILFLHVHLRTYKQLNKAHIHVISLERIADIVIDSGLIIDYVKQDSDWVNDRNDRDAAYIMATKK